MCNPLMIASAAMMVGSMVANQAASSKVIDARNDASEAEAARQAVFQEDSEAEFADVLADFEEPQQDLKRVEAVSQRDAAIDRVLDDQTNPAVPVSGSAPEVVKSTIANAITRGLNTGKERGRAQGRLLGFGDVALGNNLDLLRGAINQARIADFSGRSSNILPFELDAANSVGDGLVQLGSTLGAGGQLLGLGGATGIGPSFADLFGPSGLAGGGGINGGLPTLQ